MIPGVNFHHHQIQRYRASLTDGRNSIDVAFRFSSGSASSILTDNLYGKVVRLRRFTVSRVPTREGREQAVILVYEQDILPPLCKVFKPRRLEPIPFPSNNVNVIEFDY
jgi:hypothetical protein